MIHIKNGGASSFKKLYELTPKMGDTFLSEDGTLLVFVKQSGYVSFLRTDAKEPELGDSTVSETTIHHLFKRVEVDLIVRAI